MNEERRRLPSRPAHGPRSGRRGDAAAHPLPVGSRRTHGERAGRHSRPVAAARLAHLRLLVEAGLATRQRTAPGPSSVSPNRAGRWRTNGCAVSIRPIRSSTPTAFASTLRVRRAANRRRPFSPRAPPIGIRSARCMRQRSGSKRRSAPWWPKPFRNLLDLGTGAGPCWSSCPHRPAPSASIKARRCWRWRAPHRSGRPAARLAASRRHLRASCRTQRLRSRGHPPGAALP